DPCGRALLRAWRAGIRGRGRSLEVGLVLRVHIAVGDAVVLVLRIGVLTFTELTLTAVHSGGVAVLGDGIAGGGMGGERREHRAEGERQPGGRQQAHGKPRASTTRNPSGY